MKTKLSRLTIFIALVTFSYSASSQDFGDVLSAGAEDASTYFEHYAGPSIQAFGNGMAEGWYNTAKPHKTLGFDLTVSPSIAFIPDSDKLFKFVSSEYSNLTLEDNNGNPLTTADLPTFVGEDAPAGYELVVSGNVQYPGISYTADERFPVPEGVINLDEIPIPVGVPAPTYILGIGVYKNTDLKLRITPELNFGDFRTKVFGIGVMHDIKQWIPGIKNLPFDLSGLFASSKLTMEYDIDVSTGDAISSFDGQGTAVFTTSATTIQGIISKKLLFFTPYAAVGVNFVSSSFDVTGTYRYTANGIASEEINDPIALELEGAGGMRASVGARIKLAVFTLHGAYTLQKYNTLSLGVGISVR